MQLVTKKAYFVIVGSKLFCIWINGPYYRVSHNLLRIPYPVTTWYFFEMHHWGPLPSKYEAPQWKINTPSPHSHRPIVKEINADLPLVHAFYS